MNDSSEYDPDVRPEVVIVVVTYNSARVIEPMLDSVAAAFSGWVKVMW